MIVNNPYYYHPQPIIREAADDVLLKIHRHPEWRKLFTQGKMLGVLLVEGNDPRVHYINNIGYLVAYSGVVNGLSDPDCVFVTPIYDLQNPDDFYLQKDAEITAINHKIKDQEQSIASLDPKRDKTLVKKRQGEIRELKSTRHQLSIALQKEIFSHFDVSNPQHKYRNIIDLFAEAKRGLPPGGTGECAAPRLLQYAYKHELKPLQLAEFWFGRSPRNIQRIHGHFYPSCIEKCSPLLSYMLPEANCGNVPEVTDTENHQLSVLYEDEHIVVVNKPAGLLSVPAKDLSLANVGMQLHAMSPAVKGPMLVHRLDQSTSGILLAAKHQQAFSALQTQFVEKSLQKRYVAVIHGKVPSRCGIISLPLTVNPDERPRQVVDFQFGKQAVTYYEKADPIRWFEGFGLSETEQHDYSVLYLYPLTGRTHQLRVHCASPLGFDAAMLGDNLYDVKDSGTLSEENENKNLPSPRLMLHAQEIRFNHPITGLPIHLTAPID